MLRPAQKTGQADEITFVMGKLRIIGESNLELKERQITLDYIEFNSQQLLSL
ncbi:MAG: hypothetical protein JJV98_14160 [Desulfosarcina sp.]|nr:hypothetical protein [Desulfobacterales bacterium]